MRRTIVLGRVSLLLAGAVLSATASQAAWIGAKSGEDADPTDPSWRPDHLALYGSEQNVLGRYLLNGTDLVQEHGGICAAVATMNSFVYLENRYSHIYGAGELTSGNPQQATRDLAAGWDGREGMYGPKSNPPPLGTAGTDQRIWENKLYWVEDNAPETTVFHGQYFDSTTGWYRGGLLEENTYPTWGFLWNELARCQDVEIAFDKHCVTLVDLYLNDQDGDGKWDPGESASMGYLDPNPDGTGNQYQTAALTSVDIGGGDKKLQFDWWQDGKTWDIEFAFVESPIPEPASILIWFLLVALSITGGWRRRRRPA